MMGMDERSGKLIEGKPWVEQAIRRGLRTLKGSKPMVRWYGTNHLKHVAREITAASVLELTGDLADSIEGTIPGASVNSVARQRDGEELLVSLNVDTKKMNVEV